MPDPETVEDRPQIKPFAAWLQEQRQGGLHGEVSDALAELVSKVAEHGKAGTLTLTVKVSPSKVDGAVEVDDKLALKAPEPEKSAALFFADSRGNLSRQDPRQPELPLREISSDRKAS